MITATMYICIFRRICYSDCCDARILCKEKVYIRQ